MSEAQRDQNFVPSALGVSNSNSLLTLPFTIDSATGRLLTDAAGGAGTVTSVSVVSANGFAGTVANPTTTPAITLSTTITGILKGNGTAISAATDGSDYLSSTTGVTVNQTVGQTIGATGARLTKLWATDITVTNAIVGSITGNATTVTTNANLTGVITSVGNATSIASQTGTGTKFVVDTSPTLVTPILGVATATSINKIALTAPATSATLTIADGKTLTVSNSITLAGTDGKGINVGAATSRKILVGDGSNMVLSTETYAVPGISGNVLTSDGINWTSAAPAGSTTPKIIISTTFETSGRFPNTATGGGNVAFSINGCNLNAVTNGSIKLSWLFTNDGADANPQLYLGSPTGTISVGCQPANTGSNGTAFFGIGRVTVDATGHTFTVKHIGFKLVCTSGVTSLFATQADGTTENASSALTTVTGGDYLDLIFVINGSSNVSYYWRKNGGSLSAATTLSGNMPTTEEDRFQFSVSNNGGSALNQYILAGASYSR